MRIARLRAPMIGGHTSDRSPVVGAGLGAWPRAPRDRAVDALWLTFWIAASSAWCLSAAFRLGATFDEPLYLRTGLDGWRTDSHSGLVRLGTMPLPADLQTLPLYLYEWWRQSPFDPAADLGLMLPWVRAVTLLFWWALLIYGWLTGRALAGRWGGRLAVALLACEPSLLAHASLATTDLALAACSLALVYHFRTGRDAGWIRRVGLPALWFAAAVLSKASGLVIGALCLVTLDIARLWRLGRRHTAGNAMDRGAAGRAAIDIACIVAGGLLLAFVYCGSDWRREPSFVAWADSLPLESGLRAPMRWLAEHLRIFSNAGEALVRQVRHNVRGHGAYLLGVAHQRALWYYFPVLLTIKLSEPLLLALPVVAVLCRRALANWALLLAAALLAFSLTFRVQLGIRMVLPIVVLLTVGVAAALAEAIGRTAGARARALASLAAAAVLWNAGNALVLWPHGLAYVNRFWGGTEHGYRLVSDSNYDWGQGVRELLRWQREHGAVPLAVWYFGTDPLANQPPLHPVALHTLAASGPDDVIAAVRGHLLAVSTTLLHGSGVDSDGYREALAVLHARRPIDRTTTFLIYDFTAG